MKTRRGKERGATLVEFAFAALAVQTALFAVLEVGRLMMSYVTIAEAARVGVRYAIVNGANIAGSVATKQAAVKVVVQDVGTAAGLTLTIPDPVYTKCATCSTVQDVSSIVTVTVSYTFVPVVPLVSALGLTMTSTRDRKSVV